MAVCVRVCPSGSCHSCVPLIAFQYIPSGFSLHELRVSVTYNQGPRPQETYKLENHGNTKCRAEQYGRDRAGRRSAALLIRNPRADILPGPVVVRLLPHLLCHCSPAAAVDDRGNPPERLFQQSRSQGRLLCVLRGRMGAVRASAEALGQGQSFTFQDPFA